MTWDSDNTDVATVDENGVVTAVGFGTARITVTTADGSYGQKGFVTAALQNLSYTYLYACGPLPMLKAVSEQAATPGQLSFEARMGCGFGACRGCTVQTKNGPKRICLEGPVLTKEEVLW